MPTQILLADDDDSIRLVLSKSLSRAGFAVRSTDNPKTLVKWAEAGEGDIIISDVLMGGEEVFTYLPDLKRSRPSMPIIIISANNTVTTALKTGEHDVFEYVPKPFDLDDVTNAVSRAAGSLTPARGRMQKKASSAPMIGRSAAMQPVYRAVSRYASGNLPVLIQGDVGTGKDLVARLIHEGGGRRDRPFIRETIFDNISLTLQKVSGGDIYIDEIAELSLQQQERLLAVMTEAEMIPANDRPRILTATRKDLRKLAETGQFRDDLLFRINVAEIRIPALAERDIDIYELAEAFLQQASPNSSRRFESEALDVLHRHDWRGNVRELENMVRRLSVLYSDDVITSNMVLQEFSKDIRPQDSSDEAMGLLDRQLEIACRSLINAESHSEPPHQTALSWVERPLIIEALRLTGGNKAKAADKLNKAAEDVQKAVDDIKKEKGDK